MRGLLRGSGSTLAFAVGCQGYRIVRLVSTVPSVARNIEIFGRVLSFFPSFVIRSNSPARSSQQHISGRIRITSLGKHTLVSVFQFPNNDVLEAIKFVVYVFFYFHLLLVALSWQFHLPHPPGLEHPIIIGPLSPIPDRNQLATNQRAKLCTSFV